MPVRCYTKKVAVSVSAEEIEFAPVVLGDTATQTVTFTNDGAIATVLEFVRVDEPEDPSVGEVSSADVSVESLPVGIDGTAIMVEPPSGASSGRNTTRSAPAAVSEDVSVGDISLGAIERGEELVVHRSYAASSVSRSRFGEVRFFFLGVVGLYGG